MRPRTAWFAAALVLAGCRAVLGIEELQVDGGVESGAAEAGAEGGFETGPETGPDSPADTRGPDTTGADTTPAPDAGADSPPPNCSASPDAGNGCPIDGSFSASCARVVCLNCCIQSASASTQQSFFVNGQNGGIKMCLCGIGTGPCTVQCNDFCMMGIGHEPACDDCTTHAIIDPAGACHGNENLTCPGCQELAGCLGSCPSQ